jgi:hypothetical protein
MPKSKLDAGASALTALQLPLRRFELKRKSCHFFLALGCSLGGGSYYGYIPSPQVRVASIYQSMDDPRLDRSTKPPKFPRGQSSVTEHPIRRITPKADPSKF